MRLLLWLKRQIYHVIAECRLPNSEPTRDFLKRKKQPNQKKKKKKLLCGPIWAFTIKKQVLWSICFKMCCGKYFRDQKPSWYTSWYTKHSCNVWSSVTKKDYTVWKVSVVVVFLVRIFQNSDWIRTRKSSNTDTFPAVLFTKLKQIHGIIWSTINTKEIWRFGKSRK